MKFYINLLFLAFFGLSCTYSQRIATGFVYEDVNQNQKKDKAEEGLEKVAVSNGIEVVLTDKKGKFEIPVGDDNILFVIKPSGYALPVNDHNQPQFFYIHKPEGSPGLKYAGVTSTGELPRSVDFGLIPDVYRENFKMLAFGDPQPYSEEEVDFFYRGIVKEVKGVDDVAFGLTLGDLVGDNLNLFNPYRDAVKEIGIPWFNVMGNHDMNIDTESDSLSDETFERHFGPANYAFNHGKVHFIVLDDILYPDPREL